MQFNKPAVYRRAEKETGPQWGDFKTWGDYDLYYGHVWFKSSIKLVSNFVYVYQEFKNVFGKFLSVPHFSHLFTNFKPQTFYRVFGKLSSDFLYLGNVVFLISRFIFNKVFGFSLSLFGRLLFKFGCGLSLWSKNIFKFGCGLSLWNKNIFKLVYKNSCYAKCVEKFLFNTSLENISKVYFKSSIVPDPDRWISYPTWTSMALVTGGDWKA